MEFFPHVLLFVPICIFAALFAAAAAMNIMINASTRPRSAKPAAQRGAIPGAGPGAQIIYFRPRKTPLPSGFNVGLR
jgi:hypothetical protein